MHNIQNINGVWTVIGCKHQTESVKTHGKLDCDNEALSAIHPHIKEGDTVLDAGANIGTHTYAYLKWVGSTGTVISVEPHPAAFECLSRNCRDALLFPKALGDLSFFVSGLVFNDESPALTYVVSNASTVTVESITIDEIMHGRERLDFLKIDVEGSESAVLRGGASSILCFHPAMFIEINHEALKHTGSSSKEVTDLILDYGYKIKQIGEGGRYDLLCTM